MNIFLILLWSCIACFSLCKALDDFAASENLSCLLFTIIFIASLTIAVLCGCNYYNEMEKEKDNYCTEAYSKGQFSSIEQCKYIIEEF